jgi:hypothetical protein
LGAAASRDRATVFCATASQQQKIRWRKHESMHSFRHKAGL